MEPETLDAPEVLETPEIAGEVAEAPAAEPQTDEEKEALQKEVDDLKKKNSQLYERVKKAKEAPSKSDDGLSNKDVLFLAKTDVHEEDMDQLLEWAKFKKVSVPEAYKELKSVLDVKAEERRTAAAAHTQGGARGASKVSGQDLLSIADRTGELPTSDEGMQALFLARQDRRLNKS